MYKHPKSFIINRPFGAGAYDLVLFKTKTVIEINGDKIVTKPNSIVLFEPGCTQRYYTYEDYLLNDFVHFKLDAESKEVLLGDFPFNIPFAIEQVDYISNLLWLIAYEYNNSYSRRENNMAQLLTILIKKVEEELSLSKQHSNYGDLGAITSVKSTIMSNPQKNWTIAELAGMCNMSESYFQIMYKKIFNSNCISDVINARLTMAKDLVRNTSSSMQEIAICCGYNNVEHFSRQFKAKFGMSPLKYRTIKMNKTSEK